MGSAFVQHIQCTHTITADVNRDKLIFAHTVRFHTQFISITFKSFVSSTNIHDFDRFAGTENVTFI